ncbi:hypothetical protein PCASD_09416 [Puccinia coronata f. sp. avenae]|uniref:Uncharacterized protein n=1 Tax=Puccinia coronata f. sp. avenae TaxID=200324 RepID=A0A2N5UHN9_9BASI|nr:hypothetical protein PCASD_09416 [Puccinia coronata f. sp. avenae]
MAIPSQLVDLGSAGSSTLSAQVQTVTSLLGSLNGKSGQQVVDTVNRILNIEFAESKSRNNIRNLDPNNAQIAASLNTVGQNGPALIASLQRLKDLAASGASPQVLQAQLDTVKGLRDPVLQANNALIQAGQITSAVGTSNSNAFSAALQQQFTDVSQSLDSLRGQSGSRVVDETNRIIASQQAEGAARNAFLASRQNDPQIASSLQNLATADQNLNGALLRLRDVAKNPQAAQQQLNQVNAIRQTVAQANNGTQFAVLSNLAAASTQPVALSNVASIQSLALGDASSITPTNAASIAANNAARLAANDAASLAANNAASLAASNAGDLSNAGGLNFAVDLSNAGGFNFAADLSNAAGNNSNAVANT